VNDAGVVVLVALAMAAGLVGTVVPILPGLLLVWGAGVAYGLAEGFGTGGVAAVVVMAVLALAGTAAGVVLPRRAAGGAGASRSSLWLGALLAVVGFFVVPVVGLPLGGAVGIFVGEQLRTGSSSGAWRATAATLAGFGLAALVQFGAGVLMVLTWVVWVLAD
jgi:uncharacterized protein YqgC (DUF456 family)